MKNNKSYSGIKRLIKYLKFEFILDKGIDFLLIFIGLYAALSLESSIIRNTNKNQYIEDLKNIYIEISKNKIQSIKMENQINTHSEYPKDIFAYYLDESNDPPHYVVKMFNEIHFSFNAFNSFDKEIFTNKSLMSDIFQVYNI